MPEKNRIEIKMITLYDDQQEFIADMRRVWRDHTRFIGYLPTGGGKTRCAAKICEGMINKGLTVTFTVPRISLIQQTANSFIELGLTDLTVLHREYDFNPSAKIIITTQQTLTRRKYMPRGLYIIDEAHKRQKKILEWMNEHPEQRYIGLTATPFPKWMGEYYTGFARGKSMRWMIENGRLSEYDVYAPDIPDLTNCKTKKDENGDYEYREGQLAEIMGDAKIVGNVISNWVEHGENRLTICLAVNVLHANQMCNDFNAIGVNAEVITASTPSDDRHRIFERYRAGIVRVLVAVDTLTEGADFPECDCLINARPTKSLCRYIQGFGRVLRFVEGKRAIIFDHSGTTLDLGLPCGIEVDGLSAGDDGLSEASKRSKEEKKEKKPKQCPKCKFVKPAGVYKCPQCGFAPRAGDGVESLEDVGLKKIKGTKKTYTHEQKQKYYSELLGWQMQERAKGRNTSDGRISHLYREKFGVWPRGMTTNPKPPSPELLNMIQYNRIQYAKTKAKAEK
ncbi:MAG: DEAD/DEAH box helicase [Marinagarivorans sp.]|nr:DEAD/DEAH box helicase [Marinagarivorans sp.]